MDKALSLIQSFLEHQIGINPHYMSRNAWIKALQERLALSGIADPYAYYQKLQNSPYEYQELLELIIVPETWFFRDRAAFDCLIDYINSHMNKRGVFRILSIPCSSGEEPYSIVMALEQAQISLNYFHVDAVDISKKALAKARMGEYGKNSFRGRKLDYRERFFDCNPVNNLYTLKKGIKENVHFTYGNACDQKLLEGKMLYDVIFCRSLLIYLNHKAQHFLLKNLAAWLQDDGLLIVSPAEIDISRREGFFPKTHGKAIALYKQQEKPLETTSIETLVPKKETQIGQSDIIEKKHNDLQDAKKLADKGQFEQSEKICHAYMEKHGFDAEAYFLLGLIEHAKKQEDLAEDFFSKAIYLNPNHYEALYYMALLAENRGNFEQGKLYRERAKKSRKDQ